MLFGLGKLFQRLLLGEIVSKGIYNKTYFINHPEERNKPAIMYCVVLVNKQTSERECLKIGITQGTSWKDALKRSSGFGPYEARIQKIVSGTLEEIFELEQYLHEAWADYKYLPKHKFGGWQECFEIRKEIIQSIPNDPQKISLD